MPAPASNLRTLPSLPIGAARASISTSSPSASLFVESYAAPSQSAHSTDSNPSDSNPHTPTRASPHAHHVHSPHGHIPSKAADLLYGGHKSDGHGKKVYDLLGMTAKQYEKVQQQQHKLHAHDSGSQPAGKKEEQKEAADTVTAIQPIVAVAAGGGGGHRRQSSRIVGQNKAMDLLYGGHKADSKVGDMLGVSKQEMEHFRESQKAYQKLGVGATPATHDELPRDMHLHAAAQQHQSASAAHSNSSPSATSPASSTSQLALSSPSAVMSPTSLSVSTSQHGNRRGSISKKASDLLYGSNKSNSKLEDRLGIMEKELETFGRIPKAYQVMGVYDHRDVRDANKQQALAQAHALQNKAEAGQLLSPPSGARPELSVSSIMHDRLVSLNRAVSLSMVPISPLSTFTALPNFPLSPPRHSSNAAFSRHNQSSLDIPPLNSSRPSTAGSTSNSLTARSDSDASASTTSMATSPRSRRVVLQPLLGVNTKGFAGSQWTPMSPGGKLSEVAEGSEEAAGGALSAAARVRARERASRLRSKVKVAVALSSWQQRAINRSAKNTARAVATPSSQPRTPSSKAPSSALLFSPTVTVLQLGVSGRSLGRPALTIQSERPDESTIVSSLSLSPVQLSPPQLPHALRPLPAKPNRRQQLSPVKLNKRSPLPGEVREEAISSGAKRWGKVGVAVHVAAVMKAGAGLSGGLGSPMRGRGEGGFPAGKSTVYVAPNYKV